MTVLVEFVHTLCTVLYYTVLYCNVMYTVQVLMVTGGANYRGIERFYLDSTEILQENISKY